MNLPAGVIAKTMACRRRAMPEDASALEPRSSCPLVEFPSIFDSDSSLDADFCVASCVMMMRVVELHTGIKMKLEACEALSLRSAQTEPRISMDFK